MNRDAVTYGRKSPTRKRKHADGTDNPSESIEWQLEKLDCFCDALGFPIVGRYSDFLKSGKSTKGRDGLEAAIAHAIRVKGVLCVYDWSRLTRDLPDVFAISRRLTKGKAALRSIVDGVCTDTADGELNFGIKILLHQFQRRLGAEKTSDSMLRHQKQLRRMTRADRTPFGYRPAADGKALEADPAEQAAILRIKALAQAGENNHAIARQLDAEGFQRRGKRFVGAHSLVAAVLARA